jgi:hypothetical protein
MLRGCNAGMEQLRDMAFSLSTALVPQLVRSAAPRSIGVSDVLGRLDVEAVNELMAPGQGTLRDSAMFFVSIEALSAAGVGWECGVSL